MKDISKDIIINAASGDINSFEKIYKEYSGFVYNVVLRVINNREDAEEVLQNVFIKVYEKVGDFKFRSSFRTWLYRIAVNLAINYSKKMSKARNNMRGYNDAVLIEKIPDFIEERIEKEHKENIVAKLLNMLSPEQRACMVLRHIEELSYEEISKVLNVNINTIRTRLKRAREQLLRLRTEAV